MTKLEELNKEFKKYREWGYNQYESAERAVNEVFADTNVKPHIYQDKYEDASHIFFDKQVLFFHGSIYGEYVSNSYNDEPDWVRDCGCGQMHCVICHG